MDANKMQDMKAKALRSLWCDRISDLIVNQNAHPSLAMRCVIIASLEDGETLVSPPIPDDLDFVEGVDMVSQAMKLSGKMCIVIAYNMEEGAFVWRELNFVTDDTPNTQNADNINVDDLVSMIPDSPDDIKWS